MHPLVLDVDDPKRRLKPPENRRRGLAEPQVRRRLSIATDASGPRADPPLLARAGLVGIHVTGLWAHCGEGASVAQAVGFAVALGIIGIRTIEPPRWISTPKSELGLSTAASPVRAKQAPR